MCSSMLTISSAFKESKHIDGKFIYYVLSLRYLSHFFIIFLNLHDPCPLGTPVQPELSEV
jgi:hypothetical protein